MFLRKYIILMCLLSGIVCHAQDDEPNSAQYCQRLLNSEKSIPAELIRLMGSWDSCILKDYRSLEYGINALIVAQWDSVTLTVEYKAPETAIYIVEVNGDSPMSSKWYENNKTNLIDKFFDMNWKFDEFPGPSSEHYISSDTSANAQLWVERNKSGHVTWMRFSYAL